MCTGMNIFPTRTSVHIHAKPRRGRAACSLDLELQMREAPYGSWELSPGLHKGGECSSLLRASLAPTVVAFSFCHKRL